MPTTDSKAAQHYSPRGVTIDSPAAHELDDALWLDGDTLTVCVPDVASAVPPNHVVEQQAFARGSTRYFAAGSDPMLPRTLAESHLSLLPDAPRAVLAIDMRLNAALDVVETDLRRAVLTSEAQLEYAEVPHILAEPNHSQAALRPLLAALASLALRLAQKRRGRGEIAFVDVQAGWASGEEGQIRRLEKEEANIGFLIVQEMMLLTNRTLAALCVRANVPALYRNHRASVAAPPRETLLADLEATLHHPDLFDPETTRQRVQLVLQRARYSPYAEGHFGLNLPAYGHFTSPLRRYADFVNGRLLAELAEAQQVGRDVVPPYGLETLAHIGDHLHALVSREEEAKDTRYRERALRQAEQRLQEEAPSRLASLSGSDAYQVLKAATQATEPPDAFAQALRARLQRETVTPKELCHILYLSEGQNATWEPLRRDALTYLDSHPFVAVSLLAMGTALCDWPVTEYRFRPTGQEFACVASQRSAAESLTTEAYRARSKKEARQQAAVALCALRAGVPAPAPSVAPMVLPTSAADSAPTEQAADAPPSESDEVVSVLFGLCATARVRRPGFVFRHLRGEPAWQCDGRWAHNSAVYEAMATAPTKQEAKKQVCHRLLEAMRETKAPGGNPK